MFFVITPRLVFG